MYRRLTREDRYQIKVLIDSGLTQEKIAELIGTSQSTISRELARYEGSIYSANLADLQSRRRRIGVGPKMKIVGEMKAEIDEMLGDQWSPDQISNVLRARAIRVSHETIYQYVYRDYKRAGELFKNLRRKRKRRRSRATTRGYGRCGKRVNQTWIIDRPEIVEKRERCGDFERDSVLGKGSSRLLTIVDRTSGLTKIANLKFNSAIDTHYATVRLLKDETVHTITNDNGQEFSFHKLTAEELQTQIYFADPYCSWQRGSNENANGLIRQYYPKGFDFTTLTDLDIACLEDLLNNRPRKRLGYKTPNQVHKELRQKYALSS